MSMDDPTPLSQYGAAAFLSVLVQSLRNSDLPEPIQGDYILDANAA